VTFYLRRNYEEAIVHLEKAIALGVRVEEYYYELGLAYSYLDQCEKAIPWFRQALALNPDSAVAKRGLRACEPK
jgi:tetratricopeptide (TPR) repeat protein